MDSKYHDILNASEEFITLINRNYVYEVVNDAYCDSISRSRDEILGRTVAEVWGEEKFANRLKALFDRAFAGEKFSYEEKFRFGPSVKHMSVTYTPYEREGEITHVVVCSRDVSTTKRLEQRLRDFEYKDPTTGLFNRRSMELLLDKELSRARRSRNEGDRALLFVGLENFARINQSYGHHIGDVLLENTGLRIRAALRNSDYVFRFEGRELAILLTNFTNKTDIATVAEKLIRDVGVPYRHRGGDIVVGCRIGIALYPGDGEDTQTLIRNATAAMNEAAQRGEPFVFFDRELHERAVNRMQLESDMHAAFSRDEFHLRYQPIVERSGRVTGAEALIRWNHPSRGLVSPMDFIPVAEETGMIVAVGKWALFSVCVQAAQWAAEHDIYVSVNLSAREFENRELLEIVRDALAHAGGLPPKVLKLEITETESMAHPQEAIRKMHALGEMGIDIFIDDFGTGRSSLGYLKELPASTLKVDKVFVDHIADDEEERAYLASIIALGQSRNKSVLVEGVATREQAEILRELGCDRMQGYYFAKPLTAEKLTAILRSSATLPLEE